MSDQTWRYLNEAAEWSFALATVDPQAGSGPALVRLCERLLELVDGFGRLAEVDVEWHDGETSGDWKTMRTLIREADRVELIRLNLDLLCEDDSGKLEAIEGGGSLRVSLQWDGDRLSHAENGFTLALCLGCNSHDPDAEGGSNRGFGLRNQPRLWSILHRLHTGVDGRLVETRPRGRHIGPYGYYNVSVRAHERPRPRIDGLLEPWLVRDGVGVYRATGDRPLLVTLADPVEVDWPHIATAISGDVRRLIELLWLGYDSDHTTVMIEGHPLGESAGMVVDDPVGLALQVADVMEEAWRAEETLDGLRPESIWVDRGRLTGLTHRWPLFLDLARNTCAGALSPFDDLYLAPEILGAEAGPSPRSDIWLLSVLLHTWFSGRFPFEYTSMVECIIAIRAGQTLPFKGPVALADMVSRGVRPDPSARPSMAELVAALQSSAG